jgi:hypothetical protein
MNSCDKYGELELLQYMDGSLVDKKGFEEHLLKCEECFLELLELNRIEARMDNLEAKPLKKRNFLLAVVKNGLIDGFMNLAGEAKLETLPQTRKENREEKRLFLSLDSIPAKVIIIPAGEGSFWVSVESTKLSNQMLEFRRKGEAMSLYSRKSDSAEAVIKGVTPGEYEIAFAGYTIEISILKS